MLPNFKTVVSHYSNLGCLNASVLYEHIFDRMSTNASVFTLCEPADQYLIDVCVFANQIVPGFLHSKRSNEELRSALLTCIERAKETARSQGWTSGYPDDERVYSKALTYVIECVRQNLDSAKRSGESWSYRVARLLNRPAFTLDEQTLDVTFKFPYHNPMGFIGESTDEDLLNNIMHYIEYTSSAEARPITPITYEDFRSFVCDHCTVPERTAILKGVDSEDLACWGLVFTHGTDRMKCVAAVDISGAPTIVCLVTEEGTKLNDYAEELLNHLVQCSQTTLSLLVQCPSQWDTAFWAYQRGWTRPVFNCTKNGVVYFVLRHE